MLGFLKYFYLRFHILLVKAIIHSPANTLFISTIVNYINTKETKPPRTRIIYIMHVRGFGVHGEEYDDPLEEKS
jgi:hypothetical protein